MFMPMSVNVTKGWSDNLLIKKEADKQVYILLGPYVFTERTVRAIVKWEQYPRLHLHIRRLDSCTNSRLVD